MRRELPGDLDVACPLCHAKIGLPCRSTGGHGPMDGLVHRERRHAKIASVVDALRERLAGDGV